MEIQEEMLRLQMIEQQAGELQQKAAYMDEQIAEMQAIKSSLKEIKVNKTGEILSNLGKGIFVKTKIIDDQLFVNVGKEIIVRKDVEGVIEVIDGQVDKLFKGKVEILNMLTKLQEEAQETVTNLQREQAKAKKNKVG